MSVQLTGYAVDLERIRSVVGCRNDDLLRDLIARNRPDLDQLNEWFDFEFEGQPTIDDALGLIVSGDLPQIEPMNAQYGYALEVLCRTYGTALYPDRLAQLDLAWLYEQPELDELGSGPGPLRGLMPMPIELPGIGCIDAPDVQAKLALALSAGATTSDPDAPECYEEYASWLRTALERKASLVSFLY